MFLVILFLSPLLSFAEEHNIKEQKVCLLEVPSNSMKGPEKRMAKIIKKITEKVEEKNCQKGDLLYIHTSADAFMHATLLCDFDTLKVAIGRAQTAYVCEYTGHTREERERIN